MLKIWFFRGCNKMFMLLKNYQELMCETNKVWKRKNIVCKRWFKKMYCCDCSILFNFISNLLNWSPICWIMVLHFLCLQVKEPLNREILIFLVLKLTSIQSQETLIMITNLGKVFYGESWNNRGVHMRLDCRYLFHL